MSKSLRKKVKNLPLGPGVYIMKSGNGEILYIGKASSLRKRVVSYFSSSGNIKNDQLMDNVADIEYVECDSPEQAFILEASLIKEKKPKFNIALRDDKSYPYVAVTKEEFPRVFIFRPKKEVDYLLVGPYPRVKPIKTALNLIRKIFPFRSCPNLPKTPCLFYHINLCPAPCIGRISVAEYKERIDNICKILRGERKKLVRRLEKKMKSLAEVRKFEEAGAVRDRLLAVHNLYQGRAQTPELLALKQTLNLPSLPLVIEAIDISSLGASVAGGSVVVFKDGVPDKNNYRRYRIRQTANVDDYAMIKEVVRRRYNRLKKEKKEFPDLIVIDGGKAHVGVAKQELDELGVDIPVIGIAKGNEEVWFPGGSKPLIIPKNSSALYILQRVRNEAHRFAHNYSYIRRRKKLMEE